MSDQSYRTDSDNIEPAPRRGPRDGRFILILIICSLAVGLVVVSPYFLTKDERDTSPGGLRMISSHDMPTHLAVMEEFDKLLRQGILYPRWLPDINNGYGNATMNFYPPGFYYITSLVNLLFGDWVKTMFAISVLGLAASGLALYFLSAQFYGRLASAIAALFYMLLPYHVLELYWRGAMPEYIGFILIPLIVYFTFRTGSRGRLRDYAGLGLIYGLHLLIHFPVSYLLTYTLALYAIIWAARERHLMIAVRIGMGMALGLMMSAIYWLPAAMEGRYTQEFISEIFPYEGTLISIRSGTHPFDLLIHYAFIAQTAALLIAILVLVLTGKKERGQPGRIRLRQDFLWIVMGIFSTLMCTVLATHISRLIPRIQATVPAWRWLAIAGVFTALAMAAAVERLTGPAGVTRLLLWGYRLALFIVIGANVWLTVQQAIIGSLGNGTLIPFDHFYQAGFTPRGSVVPEQLPDTEKAVIRGGGGSARVLRWDALQREIEVTAERPTLLRLKSYHFPGWRAKLNGQDADLISDASGVQTIQVPEGRHRVEVSFENTAPRTAGTAMTIAAFLIMLALAVKRQKSEGEKQNPEFRIQNPE